MGLDSLGVGPHEETEHTADEAVALFRVAHRGIIHVKGRMITIRRFDIRIGINKVSDSPDPFFFSKRLCGAVQSSEF